MDVFADVKALVLKALDEMVASGQLPEGLDMAAVTVEPPRDAAHGDMATNAAMVLARQAKRAPREIGSARLHGRDVRRARSRRIWRRCWRRGRAFFRQK